MKISKRHILLNKASAAFLGLRLEWEKKYQLSPAEMIYMLAEDITRIASRRQLKEKGRYNK